MPDGDSDNTNAATEVMDDIFGEGTPSPDTVPSSSPTSNGGAAPDGSGEGTTPPPSPDGTVPDGSKQDQPPATPEPLTADKIAESTAKAVAKALKETPAPAAPPKPKGMSQAEYDAMFRRTVVGNDSVEKLLNPDTPVAEKTALLQQLLDGAANHAVMRAKYLTDFAVKQAVEQYQKQLDPLFKKYNESETKAARDTFMKEYPGFDEKSHREILGASVAAVKKELAALPAAEQQVITPQKVMEMVATRAANIIKQVNPNFDPKANPEGGAAPTKVGSAVPSATQRSFPAGAKVDITKSKASAKGGVDADPMDALFDSDE